MYTGLNIFAKLISASSDKIARLRSEAKAQTLRKAAITAEQLQRRYALVYRSLEGPNSLNPAAAVRWYAAANPETQASIEEVEPLTWIKHLLDRRGRNQKARLPWHLSALIVEEYVRSRMRPEMMETIPEHHAAPPSITHQSPSVSSNPYSVRSRPTSITPSMPGILYDEHVSFEPYVESSRGMSEDSRRSEDGYLRTWRNSLVGSGDSPRSSLSSPSAHLHQLRADFDHSPLGSRINIKGITSRARRKAHESDDGSSSAHNSMSGDQSQDGKSKSRKGIRSTRPLELALDHHKSDRRVRSLPTSELDEAREDIEAPMTIRAPPKALSDDGEPTAMPQSDLDVKTPGQRAAPTPRIAPLRLGPRLPAQSLLLNNQRQPHHHEEIDEEEERQEYELKAQ